MNKQTFIQLIKDPSGISPEQLLELEKVVAGFPYCQDAHILIAKQAADNGSMLADQKVKKAAAYTLDRKNLKKLITGGKEKELPEVKLNQFRELPPVEKPVAQKQEEPIAEVQEEKPVETIPVAETILPIQEKQEEIKPEPTESNKEALTDEKRDQIIRELQENLKKLHDIKIKTAWEEIPEKLEIVGVDTTAETSATTEKTEVPLETVSEISALVEEPTVVQETVEEPLQEFTEEQPEERNETVAQETEEINEPELQKIVNSEFSEKDPVQTIEEKISELPSSADDLYQWLNPQGHNYPVRTEDVVVAVKETEADAGLLLEYIHYLEEKRSIFRKNKKKEVEIIDKIIKEDPTIPKLDINNLPDNSVDLSSKSITISKGPVSENFAKILGLQGKKEKAIEIYEQLILKNPEKKPYFEAQIEKLKNKI